MEWKRGDGLFRAFLESKALGTEEAEFRGAPASEAGATPRGAFDATFDATFDAAFCSRLVDVALYRLSVKDYAEATDSANREKSWLEELLRFPKRLCFGNGRTWSHPRFFSLWSLPFGTPQTRD